MDYIAIKDIVRSVSQTHKFEKDYLKAVNTSDVFGGELFDVPYSETTSLKGQFKKTIQYNDILFSEIRPANRRFGRVNIKDTADYVVSTKLMVLRKFNEEVDLDYFYYCLTNQSFLEILQRRAENRIGSFPQITFDLLGDYKFPIPTLAEQKQIASVIAHIDSKIRINQEINRNLEAMARQLYDYWFVQFDFPDENGKPYKSCGGKMVWNEKLKQEVPEYWTVSTIGKLASLNKSSLSKKEKLDELIYLDTSSLTENKIDTLQRLKREDAPSRAQRKVKKNTILYSTVRPRLKHYGILCSPPETLIASTGFCTIDANSLKYSFWLYLFLTEEKITNKLGDIADTAVSSYPSIGPSDIEGLQVCFGDDGLMNAFHEKVASLFEIMESNKNEIKALQKQRNELLPLLMNGQVSVMQLEVNCDLSHD